MTEVMIIVALHEIFTISQAALPFMVFAYLIKRCGNQDSEPRIHNMMDFTRYRA